MEGDHGNLNPTTLDDLIAERTRRPQQDPTVALTVRRLARLVAAPAFSAMLGGLALALLAGLTLDGRTPVGALPGPSAVAFEYLAQPAALASGQTPMSLGLLALAALPAMTVLFILARHLAAHRWTEAVIAAALLAILTLSVLIK